MAHAALGVFMGVAWVLMLVRFGLLAFMTGFFFWQLLAQSPVTVDMSVWYAGVGAFKALVAVAVTAWGLWAALAGRALFRDELAD